MGSADILEEDSPPTDSPIEKARSYLQHFFAAAAMYYICCSIIWKRKAAINYNTHPPLRRQAHISLSSMCYYHCKSFRTRGSECRYCPSYGKISVETLKKSLMYAEC